MKLVATNIEPSDDPISDVARPYVGEYEWLEDDGPFFDFESLVLHEDGTFDAMVDAKLVNPAVRTFGSARCVLPETGVWNAYVVGDRTKIRIRPTTSKARVYEGSIERDIVILARRGGRVVLATLPSIEANALEVA